MQTPSIYSINFMKDAVSLITEFLNTQEDEQLKIAVLGDVMLDEFYQVDVNRLSPEFPIPVMHSEEEVPMTLPGGAANVAFQLLPFNVKCTLFGIGDQRAKELLGCYIPDIVMTGVGFRTPRKRRFFDKDLPLCRWDVECVNPNDEAVKDARQYILEQFEQYARSDDPDIIIMSDYNKGFFHDSMAADLIDICNDYDIPILVDPKSGPLDQWNSCTIFKLNGKEAYQFCKHHDCYPEAIVEKLECDAMVVTQGADGVKTYPAASPSSLYNVPKPVTGHPLGYSGAGDCFAAVYAMAYALDFDFREASTIAKHAASIYVQKKHNEPVTPFELRVHCDPAMAKIMTANQLANHLKDVPGTKVFTNGCFDLLHEGHLKTLKYAKSRADILIVAINSDQSVKRLKGKNRPIVPLAQRVSVLAALHDVDFVIAFEEDTPQKVIKQIQPDIIVKGGDYKNKNVVGASVAMVEIAPYHKGMSTSSIMRKITHNG